MTPRIPDFLRRPLKKIVFRGRERFCPVCDTHVRFFHPHGLTLRPDACCPVCDSLERHRLAWSFLTRETDLFDGRPKRMLHFAPEATFERRFRRIPGLAYVTADLEDPRVMVRADIRAIPFPDNSFDVIYCSHVLEHVDDDRNALQELRRVLTDDGWLALIVPITAEQTFEDPSVIEPEERFRLFGQPDHVRVYGPDFADRIEQSGLKMKMVTPENLLGDDAEQIAAKKERLFYCRKGRGNEVSNPQLVFPWFSYTGAKAA